MEKTPLIITASYDSCSNCGGVCIDNCNYNTCKNTGVLNYNNCSYTGSCSGYCILSRCGVGCSSSSGGGCGTYGGVCSMGCHVECATNPCMTVCIGLATIVFI